MTTFSILRRLGGHLRRRQAHREETAAPEGAVVPLPVDNPGVRAAAAWLLERLMDPRLDVRTAHAEPHVTLHIRGDQFSPEPY